MVVLDKRCTDFIGLPFSARRFEVPDDIVCLSAENMNMIAEFTAG